MSFEVIHLRYIVAAAEHPSFRRAAAALNIAQPTLSKRIRELEDRISLRLFERSTGGAHLTTSGRAFVASAKQVLADLAAMENLAKAGGVAAAGRIEIGFYTSLSAGALSDTVWKFAAQHEEVDVNINEDERSALISLLERGVIDLAIVLGEPGYTNYAHMSLWAERIMVALPKAHTLATRDFVYWTDLKAEQFLMSCRDPGPEIQEILLNKLGSPGDRPPIRRFKAYQDHLLTFVSRRRAIVMICESSMGIAFPDMVYRELRDGNGPTRVGYVAYWQRNNENPVLKQFLSFLKGHPAVPPGSVFA